MLLNSTLRLWISHFLASLLYEPSMTAMPRTGNSAAPGTLVKVTLQMAVIWLQFQGPTSTIARGRLSGCCRVLVYHYKGARKGKGTLTAWFWWPTNASLLGKMGKPVGMPATVLMLSE